MNNLTRHAGLIAILISVGALYSAGIGSHGMLMWDEAHYAVLGRSLADGGGYRGPGGSPEGLRPPILPATIAAILLVAPDADDDTVRLASVGAALLCTVVVYVLTNLATGPPAATAAALLFATFPEIWRSTSYLLTELPFMVFYTPAVFFFHRGLYASSRNFLIAWPCFALALMTRYTAVLFGPTCALLILVPIVSGNREAMARLRSPHFFLGPAVAGLMLAPSFVRTWSISGDPLSNFRAASNQLPLYSEHATFPVLHYFTLLPRMLGVVPTAALAVSIGEILARRDRLGISCLIGAAVIVAWLSQYGWKEPRLISAALPFLAIATALGIDSLLRILARRSDGERLQTIVTATLVLALIAGFRLDPSYAYTRFEISRSQTLGYPSFLRAMEALERSTPESAVVMGPNCYQIAWYSHRACRALPALAEGDELSDHLDGIDYVVATSFERGQPAYIVGAMARAEDAERSRVQTFSDRLYWTKLAPAELFRK